MENKQSNNQNDHDQKQTWTTNIEIIQATDFEKKKERVEEIIKENNFNSKSLHDHHIKKSSVILAITGLLIILILVLGALVYRFIIYPYS
ncbi:hypothetical protein [Mycoplasmopsis alligatoris]|uniref:hypothetical protein n=1 Tax=Mycoplasmopsis alligatoris TaxID=47687 RepID=UPI0002D719A6|nr:hypothetical protein [Mycoplasmopsis alligatoris]